ncbi:MAG: hypothetical protein EA362_03270, partial [Saprospirales bacterium]
LSPILSKWFQVKADEVPTFIQMLGHSFFNSLGIAFSFTAINVLLIDRHGIEILPYIYLVGGLLVFLIGRLYAYFEAKLPSTQLFSIVLVFCIIWTLMTRGLLSIGDNVLILGVLYCLYLAIYQLINLEFWGAAALIYDVRQSKRLFGLLSSGESVAKMGGYFLTPFIVSFLSLSDLLFFAAASFGISFFFLFQLSRLNTDSLKVEHHHHHHTSENWLKKIKKWLPSKSLSFLQLTSYFALFSALVYYLVHYSFLNRVEDSFDDVEQLAFFFGLFFGFGKFLNLFIKTFLFSRFFNTLKIGYLVLAFPFLIALISAIGFFGQFFVDDSLLLFLIIFGSIMLLDEVLRSSVYMPSFFVLFQPLPKHQRLEGHTFAKGFMEPIGMGIAGIIMVGMIALNVFTLSSVIFFLFLAAILWFGFGWFIKQKYEEIIQFLLKNRLLSGNQNFLSAIGNSTLKKQGLAISDDPVSILYRLKIGGKDIQRSERSVLIKNLLASENVLILSGSLELIQTYEHREFLSDVFNLIKHSNADISKKAVFTYCYFTHDDALIKIDELIESSDSFHKEFVLAAVLRYSGIYGAIRFGRNLTDLLDSNSPSDRASAARIIGLTGRIDYYHPLIKLLGDADKEVRKQAVLAASKVKNPRLIEDVLKIYMKADFLRFSSITLEALGSDVVNYVKEELGKSLPKQTRIRLINLLGRIPSEKSAVIIQNNLNEKDFELRNAALDAAFKTEKLGNRSILTQIVEKLFSDEFSLFSKIIQLTAVTEPHLQLALKNELKNLKLRMLNLMGLIYNKSIIQKARDNMRFNDEHLKGNVLEMLENELRLKHSRKLTKVLEFNESELFVTNRNSQISIETFAQFVLAGEKIKVSEWTLAMLFRCCKSKGHIFKQDELDILKSIESDIIIQELNRS